ncbi:hypothetical protein ACIBKX_40495 [Streptomyces sp. NPDC050658]|uniref:hypothetical protein n=1 Tax=unclassified Streptomyces TaxID=2593676 RepID=UPI003433F530
MLVPLRRLALALTLCFSVLVGASACAADTRSAAQDTNGVAAPSPRPTTEERKLAKTRFVVDAGLAAGATYEWIWKPHKAGKFKKGHPGRTMALVKASLAGAFAYNRLKAAVANAKADPALSRALAPLIGGIDGLKNLPHDFHRHDNADRTVNSYQDVMDKVKNAGALNGATVHNRIPSAHQLMSYN